MLKHRARLGSSLAHIYVWLVMLFLFAPLLVMIVFSFNSTRRLSFPWDGPSLTWYREVFTDSLVRAAFGRSLQAAIGTALVTGVLGMLGALGVIKFRARLKTAALTASLIPLTIPGLLYAVSLVVFLQPIGVPRSIWAVTVGHVTLALPFVFITIGASLDRFRTTLLEAARDLGATPWIAFRTVTFPVILPATIGAALLAAAISMDEFIVAFFTAGTDKTLPLLMYGRVLRGNDPSLNAIGTILLVITVGLAVVSARKTAEPE